VISAAKRDTATDHIAASARTWLRFVRWKDGEVIELQALEVPESGRWTGNYFAHATSLDELIRLLCEMEQRRPMGVYYIMNEVDPRVSRRAKRNKWHVSPKKTSKDSASSTSDSDIVSRRAMLIDGDPTRPRGTSATNEEMAIAIDVAERIHARLAEILGSTAALGFGQSGNGAAVLVALDSLPNPEEDNSIISAILTALGFTYGKSDNAKVDKSVIEPKRLCAAWGTTKRKGDDDPAYPHRRTNFTCADDVQPIGRAELQEVLRQLRMDLDAEQNTAIDKVLGVKAAPKASGKAASNNTTSDSPFKKANAQDPAKVMDRLGIDACPGCGAGTGDTSFAVVNGGTKCFHDTCSGKGMPGKPGFRTNVDLVAEVKGIAPIDAVRLLGEWFGFEVPPPNNQSNNRNDSTQEPRGWTEPKPLPGGLPRVPSFDADLLPEPLRDWITDIVERTQCPIEYVAVGAIVALSAVIGRSSAIRPKRHDDWTVVPNLWGAIIGRPGAMKSPTLSESTKPLGRLAANARKQYDEAAKDFETRENFAKLERSAIEGEIKRLIKESMATIDAAERIALVGKRDALVKQLQQSEVEPPRKRQYVVNDGTVEKVIEILSQNPNGVLQFRDELIGWLKSCEREGRENDRSFYLEAWKGDGEYTQDRIGRGSIHVPGVCLSVLGGIQPGPLTEYLIGSMRNGAGADGLISRFQLLVYPDEATEWRNVDRYPDTAAKNRAYAVFERLDAGAASLGSDDGPAFVKFTDVAQNVFDDWRANLERRLRSPDEAPVMLEHLSKYRSLMPSLALILQLAEERGPVSIGAARLAIRWCEFLEAHARRIYSVVISRTETAAALLLKRIQASKLADAFTLRDVCRNGWAGLTDAEDVTDALELLEDYGWVRGVEVRTGGRPKIVYEINPAVLR
jgi:hypothetical protein